MHAATPHHITIKCSVNVDKHSTIVTQIYNILSAPVYHQLLVMVNILALLYFSI